MAEKSFGIKELNLIGASGTPSIDSPNNLNLNAVNVAISTNVSIGGTLSVTGNVSVGGTLTYEDVTNIDSVGLITARNGLNVTAGVSTFAGEIHGNNQRLGSLSNSGRFNGLFVTDGNSYYGSNKLFVSSNTGFGLEAYGDMDSYLKANSGGGTNGNCYMRTGSSSGGYVFVNGDNGVEIHHAGTSNKKFETTSSGATVTGTLTATTFSGSGASLTSLPAANLTGTLPAISGANLTNLPADTPTNSDIQVVYAVTANGAAAYRFAGNGIVSTEDNPDVYLIRGFKYRFINNSGGSHPFQIRQSSGGSAYSAGVTNNGASSGNIDFQVPYSAPSHLYYQCTSHGGMVGNLYIRGAGGNNTNVGVTTFSGAVNVTAKQLKLGNNTSSSVNSSNLVNIDLGGTFHDTAGGTGKLRLWKDASDEMSLGVSGNQMDFILTSLNYSYNFYGGGSGTTRLMQLSQSPIKLALGNETTSGVTSPASINLGGTYSSSAGNGNDLSAKLKMWTDGSNMMGLSVSGNQLDYIVTSENYDHVFYGGNAGTTELARFEGSGQMGLGTGASIQTSAKLQVSGNIGATQFYATNTSSPQTDFTSSVASNKAGLLLHRGSETNGDYGGLEFHNHPSSITTYRKGGIYFQSDGSGFGRGDIVIVNDGAGDSANLAISDEKMRIHKEGYVTKPYQVAWAMHGSGNQQNLNGGDKVAFNTNGGTGFGSFSNRNHSGVDTTNYSYTVPVTGLYSISVTIFFYTDNNTNTCSIVPRINGNQISNGNDTIFLFGASAVNANITYSGTILLQLNANDEITIHRRSGEAGTSRIYTPHSYFAGFLVG